MPVRAKLVVTEITQLQYGKRIRFAAQYDSSIPEDQRFQKATPSGFAEFQIDNEGASDQFAIGKPYYVDFTPADQPKPAEGQHTDLPRAAK